MPTKESSTQKWMREHPDDVPCPKNPFAAQTWRRARGLEPGDKTWAAYQEAMAAKRAAKWDSLGREITQSPGHKNDDGP
jgi:hypothetical protein